ncbi:MAG TPA: acyl carrier protein [Verrucomicrobiae bacterium]|nr:acyl carrier protein [Verrucomicrobiae bacterium]
MDKTLFYEQMAQILDAEEVKPENVLKDFETWDSLAVLSVMAMADSKFGVAIKADEMRSAVTAADLEKLVEGKLK